jgi:fused signal recognition particle receptor
MKKKGLGDRLRALFSIGTQNEEFFEELEDLLIESDIGATVAMETVDVLRKSARNESRDDVLLRLKSLLAEHVRAGGAEVASERFNAFLVLGVNGVGKTTTIAKLAHRIRSDGVGDSIVLAAGDTFRAAAVEQLETHGRRLGLRVVSQGQNADPGAVIYDAVESAKAHGDRLLIADTAGRLHNKANLIQELSKIDKIIRGRSEDANYRKILIIDATTGQNGLRQAEIFHEAVGVDSIVLAKYDSTAKGGILIPIARSLEIPCSYLGVGEGMDDLVPFDGDEYLNDLLGIGR